jgi:hypothetical protein
LGLRIIAPTARIIPRIIWGENRAQVRSEPEKTVCGGKPLWDSGLRARYVGKQR